MLINGSYLHRNDLDEIYFFKSENIPYLFCKNNKKVFKIIKKENEYWKLIEYSISKEINTKELILIIKQEIDNNKKVDTLRNYQNVNYDNFKKFYLINENWLNNQINEVDRETLEIKPRISEDKDLDFGFIEKNENNSSIINKLKFKNEKIKDEDLYIADLFFIKGNSNIHPNKLYIGLIYNKKDIFFYLIENKKYILKFVLYYESEEVMKHEIDKNIIPKGIEEYLFEMGIDFSITDELQNLYNIELERVGSIYNKSKMDIIGPQHTRNLEGFQGSYYYCAIMQCLANIGFLKDKFLNREKLFNKNIIKGYKKITNLFYKIIQYMWYSKSNLDEEKGKYMTLLYEIQSLSGINNIYDRLDSLIEFLLLAIHSEQSKQNKEENISYNLNDLQNEFYNKNDSFIKDLIYFKLEISCDKCHNKNNLYNYILYFSIRQLIPFNKIKNNTETNTESLLSLKQEIFCYKCKNVINSKKKFISFPKILIIIIQDKDKNNIKFKLNEKLIIEKKQPEYELISLIKEFNKNDREENKKVITYLKSPINNSWYKYEEQHSIELLSFDIIENDKTIPSLLIYKIIDTKK